MLPFLLLLLIGVEEDEFALELQAMARSRGCEVQAVMEDDGGDVRISTFTCPDSRRAVLWARGDDGRWTVVEQFACPLPTLPRGSGI